MTNIQEEISKNVWNYNINKQININFKPRKQVIRVPITPTVLRRLADGWGRKQKVNPRNCMTDEYARTEEDSEVTNVI